jgi:hypothetical protein
MESIRPEEFENQVYDALKAAFRHVTEANADQHFYTFGLFTDDSLQFLHPVANTEEALSKTVERYRKEVDPKYDCVSTRAGMRWSYGDWGFFPDVGGGSFDEINQALSANFDRVISDEDADDDLEPLWMAILNAFVRAEKESVFGEGSERSNLTLLMVGDLPEEFVNAWVTELNPSEVANQYVNWDPDAPDNP